MNSPVIESVKIEGDNIHQDIVMEKKLFWYSGNNMLIEEFLLSNICMFMDVDHKLDYVV